MKNFYRRSYRDFKLNAIRILLQASNVTDYPPEEDLLDVKKFREFFNQEKWYKVANGLDNNSLLLEGIIEQLTMLKEETYFLIDKLDLENQVFVFLKNTSQLISHYKIVGSGIDDLKWLMGFLWQIFAAWSFINGFSDKDYMEEMLDRI